MNRYLFEQIGRARREALIDDAAAARLASSGTERRPARNRPHRVWAGIRGALAASQPTLEGILPRLSGYPTARS